MDCFEKLDIAPPDPILGLARIFKEDRRPHKVNLGVGTYCTEELQPLIFTSVKEAERRLIQNEKSKDYLPIEGPENYLTLSHKLLFGSALSDEVAAVQAVGGTSALWLGGKLAQHAGFKKIYLPMPTWGNHKAVFLDVGLSVDNLPYYDEKSHQLDFEALLQAIEAVPSSSIILLHGCCHNPSGLDPSYEQWQILLETIKKKQLFPFFDIAYQGLGVGLEEDALAIRLFREADIEMAVAMSFSKNFGLYSERAGVLFFICKDKQRKEAVQSQLKVMIRANYSNPPSHGIRIITEILQDPLLKSEWAQEVTMMRTRIDAMRIAFTETLQMHTERFAHIAKARGMFAFTGLSVSQVEKLMVEHAIYMLKNGRINLAGLNRENIAFVADKIISVMHS